MPSSSNMPGPSRFRTTHWSIVLNAGGAKPDSSEALEQLYTAYWRPVHGFIRWRGHDEDAARDLTQGFFAQFAIPLGFVPLPVIRGCLFAAVFLDVAVLLWIRHSLLNGFQRVDELT
jgi:hypothetical protein